MLAFAAQKQWLELFGLSLLSEFELDPFTLLVCTSCLGSAQSGQFTPPD
jgi:hypothetical protein